VRVNLVELGPDAFRWLHRVAALALVGALALALRRRAAHADGLRAFALVALAMVALSERSWKQHYVVLVLPIAYLVGVAFQSDGRTRRLALAALGTSAAAHALSGEGLLGERASDLVEAHGAFLLGAGALAAATAALYSRPPSESDAGAPAGACDSASR
jgi:hypothetical protein